MDKISREVRYMIGGSKISGWKRNTYDRRGGLVRRPSGRTTMAMHWAGANGGGTTPLSARLRRERGGRRAGGREKAGSIPPGGSGHCHPALARVGRRAGARRCAGVGVRRREDVTWHVSIDPRGLSVELAVI
jgi:hypothetical protein